MFEQLSQKLTNTVQHLRGIGRLTPQNIEETLKQIRIALIDADVALDVVSKLIKDIQEEAIGTTFSRQIRPGDALIKLMQNKLTETLGQHVPLDFRAQPPVVILMAGLQGSGKTTSTAKLALHICQEHQKSVLITSTDIYRPAAMQQLATLATNLKEQGHAISYWLPPEFSESSKINTKPLEIVKAALTEAKNRAIDVLIIDTAGRLHIDDAMMTEIEAISHASRPTETLLVVDSMTGQVAVDIAKQFNQSLNLTGIILTKIDGDARGGAALSMATVTQKPIKFLGVGEKITALEPFHPDRIASRILGMGDVVGLVKEAEKHADKQKALKIAKKLHKGRFDFNDFLTQIQQMKDMGGLKSILGKLPGMGALPKAAKQMVNDDSFKKVEAMINSMTRKERAIPTLLLGSGAGSRKRRIAAGAGTNIQDVNRMLKQYGEIQKFTKRLKGKGKLDMLKQLKQFKGKLPPNLLGGG